MGFLERSPSVCSIIVRELSYLQPSELLRMDSLGGLAILSAVLCECRTSQCSLAGRSRGQSLDSKVFLKNFSPLAIHLCVCPGFLRFGWPCSCCLVLLKMVKMPGSMMSMSDVSSSELSSFPMESTVFLFGSSSMEKTDSASSYSPDWRAGRWAWYLLFCLGILWQSIPSCRTHSTLFDPGSFFLLKNFHFFPPHAKGKSAGKRASSYNLRTSPLFHTWSSARAYHNRFARLCCLSWFALGLQSSSNAVKEYMYNSPSEDSASCMFFTLSKATVFAQRLWIEGLEVSLGMPAWG